MAEETSLDAAVSAAYDKAHPDSSPAVEQPASSPASPEAPASPSDAPPAASPGERARDEKGRFAPKETGGDRVLSTEEGTGATAEPKASAPPDPAKPDPLSGMGMTKGDAEMFRSLPEAAQKFLTRRYREMEAGLQDVLPLREFQPIAEMFKPYEAQLKMQGETAASIIRKWAGAEQALQSNPQATLVRLCHMYGVDPASLAGQRQQVAQGASSQGDPQASWLAADPAYQQLQAEVQRLNGVLQHGHQQSAMTQIQAFADKTGADGKLIHPYFEKVVDTMIGLADTERRAGRAPDLEALYDRACWTSPEIREELLAAQRDRAAAETLAKAREKAAASAKAGVSVGAGAPLPGADRPAPHSDLGKTVEEAWNRAHSR